VSNYRCSKSAIYIGKKVEFTIITRDNNDSNGVDVSTRSLFLVNDDMSVKTAKE